MNRELIQKLKKIKDAYDKKNNIEYEYQSDLPSEPAKPSKRYNIPPKEPELEKAKTKDITIHKKIQWIDAELFFTILFYYAIFGVIAFLVVSNTLDIATAFLILFCLLVSIYVVTFIVINVDHKAFVRRLEEENNKAIAECDYRNRQREDEYKAKYDKYKKDLAQAEKDYARDKAKYDELLKQYKLDSKKIELENSKIRERNEERKKKAENEFERELSLIGLDFPEKYLQRLSDLIRILEDARADELKEAINLLISDDRNEKMLHEQMRLSEKETYRVYFNERGSDWTYYVNVSASSEAEAIIAAKVLKPNGRNFRIN